MGADSGGPEVRTKDGKRFLCGVPFFNFVVGGGGHVFACCSSWSDFKFGCLMERSVDEVWNGEEAVAMRQSVLDGSYRFCSKDRCPFLRDGVEQDIGVRMWRKTVAAIEGGVTRLPYGPLNVNMCHDLHCNLACPSCRRRPFRKTSDGARRVHEVMLDGVRGSVIRFTVAGQGEPFASLIYREFLEGFDKSRFPELTGIRLITNGTLLTPEAWDRVRNVHPHVRSITVSVDGGTKETYEKNRPGANFEVLLRNLEFISTLRDRMRINLSMVVQANNFREMGLVAGIARRFGMTSSFCRIFKNAMGDDEMRERAVWNPTHPDHAEMLRMVEDVSEKFCGMVDFPGLGRSR